MRYPGMDDWWCRYLAVGGFSSGGQLAASICLQARESGRFTPVLQVLGVPALDLAAEPSGDDPGMISPALRRLVRRAYFPDRATRSDPVASPLLAEDPTRARRTMAAVAGRVAGACSSGQLTD